MSAIYDNALTFIASKRDCAYTELKNRLHFITKQTHYWTSGRRRARAQTLDRVCKGKSNSQDEPKHS